MNHKRDTAVNTPTELKQIVTQKYTVIAGQSRDENAASCCGVGGCSSVDYTIFAQDYSGLQGYVADADLGLGCGVPTELAQIRPGDTVVDLGSGAGNDCFVARAITGSSGKVIGVDMTQAMIDKARINADSLGFNNVEFRLGDIEALPIAANRADVVISNCVLNLVPDKHTAFAEMYRVIKPGGHFSVSDIVLRGELPDALRHDAEMYAGCVSGAIQEADYLGMLADVGFTDVTVQRATVVDLPEAILSQYLQPAEIESMRSGGTGIVSVNVYGRKPQDAYACSPGSDCC